MSEFLDNLKKAADMGEFNSDAAKKILDINKLADSKLGNGSKEDLENLKKNIEEKYKNSVEPVTEEKALEANSEYDRKMDQLKKMDFINAQIATLTDIEDAVKLTIEDMFSFVDELEKQFKKMLEDNDPLLKPLSDKIEEIKSKYSSNIN